MSFSDPNLFVIRRCRRCCRRRRNLFTFTSSTPEQPGTNLNTKHPWVKGIQVCSNEGPRPFSSEIITK